MTYAQKSSIAYIPRTGFGYCAYDMAVTASNDMPAWRNWQTRGTQNPTVNFPNETAYLQDYCSDITPYTDD